MNSMCERAVAEAWNVDFPLSIHMRYNLPAWKENPMPAYNGKEHMEIFYALQDTHSEKYGNFPHSTANRQLPSTYKCGIRDPILHLEKFSEAFFIRLA